MDLTPVNSSQLAAVGYDPDTQTLHIKFKDRTSAKTGVTTPGATYAYDGVPAHVHAGLLAADADPALSVGSHFGAHVKGGGYVFRKII